MKGHIYLETYPDKPEHVRILSQDEDPTHQSRSGGAQLRYVAAFKNAHIAYMHVHNTLKRQLVNIDTRIYNVTLAEAIAAVEAENLKHERVWIDPEVSQDDLEAVAVYTTHFQQKQQRNNRLYLIVGGIGVLLLLFILLGGIWHA